MNWSISYYSDKLQRQTTARNIKLASWHVITILTIRGLNDETWPYSWNATFSRFGGRLFELRVKAVEGSARVFYCTLIGKKIVILHHFIKKSQKIPLKEIQLARTRMKEVL